MRGSRPRVTVGLPVYNGEAYLREALDTLLDQSFDDFELIVSDNASTDGTEGICREAARADGRVRYLRQERNLGAAPNFNLLVRIARGELFRWAAHDDLVAPTYLEQSVAALDEAGNEAVLVAPSTTEIDEAGKVVRHYVNRTPWRGDTPAVRLADLLDYPYSFLHKCYPVFGLMRTATLRSTRGIQAFESSDRVTLIEMALRGDFILIPERLFSVRIHGDSSRFANRSAVERARWFDASAPTRPPTVRTDLARAYLRSVIDAPLSPDERLRCLGVLSRWLARGREWRVIGGELRRDAGLRLRAGAAHSRAAVTSW